MRIAQVAPLYESVPPRLYGGTERVVSYLTEELVAAGHDVTLFASGDSVTSAELVSCSERALRLDPEATDPVARHLLQLEQVLDRAERFDVIHFHTDYHHFPLSVRRQYAHVTTLHGRLDLPDLARIYRRYATVPVVSISNAQRAPIPKASWIATVYHGLPESSLRFHPRRGGYLAFIGRISREKRVDRAVEIARGAGLPLKIAAKIDRQDPAHHEEALHLLHQPGVEFLGEISEAEKSEFLGNAFGLLFPIDWPEPFGLAVIEALACGTPVVAFDHGSVPELLPSGAGFRVGTVAQAIDAVRCLDRIDRYHCRHVFERRFTASRMARDYVAVYRKLLDRRAETYAEDRGRGARGYRRDQRPVLHPREVDTAR